MDKDKGDPRTYAIIGAAMEVHREQGPGFLEPVYQESFEHELRLRDIAHAREVELPIHYKDIVLKQLYMPDFICYSEVIVELKALDRLTGKEESQILNYLKASRLRTGLLINFGAERLEYKRFVL